LCKFRLSAQFDPDSWNVKFNAGPCLPLAHDTVGAAVSVDGDFLIVLDAFFRANAVIADFLANTFSVCRRKCKYANHGSDADYKGTSHGPFSCFQPQYKRTPAAVVPDIRIHSLHRRMNRRPAMPGNLRGA